MPCLVQCTLSKKNLLLLHCWPVLCTLLCIHICQFWFLIEIKTSDFILILFTIHLVNVNCWNNSYCIIFCWKHGLNTWSSPLDDKFLSCALGIESVMMEGDCSSFMGWPRNWATLFYDLWMGSLLPVNTWICKLEGGIHVQDRSYIS